MASLRCGLLPTWIPVAFALLVAAACGDSDAGGDEGSDGLRVVATTGILAEFAERVVGPDVVVETLIPAGVDVHGFSPPPSVARALANADVLIVNGYNLEERLLSVIDENRSGDSTIVVAAEGLQALAGSDDHEDGEHAPNEEDLARADGDPHLWLAVENAVRYVENIRNGLTRADAANASGYESRAAAFIEELQRLDLEVRETLAVIPEGRRHIVVSHDAYQYFARAYRFELTALLPANPGQATSAETVAAVVRLVEQEGIPAVFREPQFSATALEAVARETGVPVGILYSTLAEGALTYELIMRANAEALAEALGPAGS